MAAEAFSGAAVSGSVAAQRPDVRSATNGLCSYGRQLEDTLANFAEMLERHVRAVIALVPRLACSPWSAHACVPRLPRACVPTER